MTSEEILRAGLIAVEADKSFTEAVIRFGDNSRSCFCDCVGESWAKTVDSEDREDEAGLAGELLRAITIFSVMPNIWECPI